MDLDLFGSDSAETLYDKEDQTIAQISARHYRSASGRLAKMYNNVAYSMK